MFRRGVRFSVVLVALLGTFSCATAPRSDIAMFRHFDGARELRTAAIFGRAEQAEVAAIELRRENPLADAPSASDPYYSAFYESVADLAGVQPPDDLARAAARVALRCGECHTARGLGPTFAIGGPREADGLREHMIVHSWASSRMWESLLGGSDDAWRAGAQGLIDQPMSAELYAGRVPDSRAASELSDQMLAIARGALRVSNPPDRARVLGELWATCARCHTLAGVR
jgi:mono/diheme cytochrome c family protein